MNAEVFAKGFEKCRLLKRLLGPNVENSDDYGCPKIQELVGEGKANSSWICYSYPFRHKTRLHCASKSVWRQGCATFKFVNFFTCVLYLCLLPI